MGRIRAYKATAGTSEVAFNATTVTEQTSNGQRSLLSGSANDAAAGTGARTVEITYYSLASGVMTGPFTETVTMTGTDAVATVSTTIALVEKMRVLTGGSGGSYPAGTITMKSNNDGTGTTMGTIAAGDRRTYWGLHYVPTNHRCVMTDVAFYSPLTSAANNLLVYRTLDYSTTNAIERAQGTLYNTYSSIAYGAVIPLAGNIAAGASYPALPAVQGPARIQWYFTASASDGATNHLEIGFNDQ